MSKRKLTLLAASFAVSGSVFAGGLLTNTNQNIAFNRNFAREATIGIDGVYSNPAGVAFMNNGLHLSFNVQNAYQTRVIKSGLNVPTGVKNSFIKPFIFNERNQDAVKTYEGKASVPILPSFQAAYNKDKWSFQFGFALVGGGGKATFNDGLGSFERPISMIPLLLNSLPQELNSIIPLSSKKPSYSYDSYMSGRQYIFGAQFGAAYKVNKNVSVYGGLRVNYVYNKYEGYIKNISANVNDEKVVLSKFIAEKAVPTVGNYVVNAKQKLEASAQQLEGLAKTIEKVQDPAQKAALQAQLQQGQAQLQQGQAGLLQLANAGKAFGQYQKLVADKEVNVSQTGWGITPIIGVDVKYGKWNFASKLELNTRLNIENKIEKDDVDFTKGEKNTPHDIPGLLTLGTQYEITPKIRVMAGWHHYFDKSARMANDKQKKLSHNTNEYLAGAEWDITKDITISAGGQCTRYGLGNGSYLSDLSFVTSSYSVGFGAKFKVAKNMNLNVAYFWTNYETFKKTEETTLLNKPVLNTDEFTRTNKVFGVGLDISL